MTSMLYIILPLAPYYAIEKKSHDSFILITS